MTVSTPDTTYLRSLPAVRATSTAVFERALSGSAQYWELDLSKEDSIVSFIQSLIQRDYGGDYAKIPPHGRWRHFVTGTNDRVQTLIETWRGEGVDAIEICRRLVDLIVVSVLVDAGAGDVWKFKEPGSEEGIGRSEGLGIASISMFKDGLFSSKGSQSVDADGLKNLTIQKLENAFQSSPTNPMTGLEGRANLLIRLGTVLSSPSNAKFFVNPVTGTASPGNMVDYLLAHPSTTQVPSPTNIKYSVDVLALWEVVLEGLDVWPTGGGSGRLIVDGKAMGDVWECPCIDGIVAFHKLSQWMTYSLIEVFERTLNVTFRNKQHLTGLPEYRNGGLLIDYDLLRFKKSSIPTLYRSLNLEQSLEASSNTSEEDFDLLSLPQLPAKHPMIVEMRAITVVELDRIATKIREKSGEDLELAQVLESGTWKAGREVAKNKRKGGVPPINILSDGTVF